MNLFLFIFLNTISDKPSTSSALTKAEKKKKEKEENDAIRNLVSDLPEDEDDYLDLVLKDEETFLNTYKSLMDNLKM